MHYIYLRGFRITVEEPDFWIMVDNIVDSTVELTRLIHRTQSQGFPDYAGNLWKPVIPERILEIRALHSQLPENGLRNDLVSLESLLQELDSIDNRMIRVIAKVTEQPFPETKEASRNFRQKVDKLLRKNLGAYWTNDGEFKELIQQSKSIFQEVSQVKERVSQHIKRVQKHSSDKNSD